MKFSQGRAIFSVTEMYYGPFVAHLYRGYSSPFCLYVRFYRYHPLRNAYSRPANGKKYRVVVLGTGWSSLYFSKYLDHCRYNLTVISPRDHFLFTPLLPRVSSGKLSVKACTEPFSQYLENLKIEGPEFVHAECLDIDPTSKVVVCNPVGGDSESLSIGYDFLVVAVGVVPTSFGVPGAEEYVYYFKEFEHAKNVFENMVDRFKRASAPDVTDDKKLELLHFVVVGGGPTGVELTGEISSMLEVFKKGIFSSVAKLARVSIVEGGGRLLATFPAESSEFIAKKFGERNVNVILGKHVCAVGPDEFTVKDPKSGKTETTKCGMVIWASGLKQTNLATTIQRRFSEQNLPRTLLVDQYLNLRGDQSGTIFAIGDCCRISPDKLSENMDKILEKIGSCDVESLILHRKELSSEFPQLHSSKWNHDSEHFKKFCDETLSEPGNSPEDSFRKVLQYIDQNYMSHSLTAQNAKQQGYYLAAVLNRDPGLRYGVKRSAFVEEWRGSLVSIGKGTVIANLPSGCVNGGARSAAIWNAAYMTMFPSWRMRFRFTLDSLISGFLGRRAVLKKARS